MHPDDELVIDFLTGQCPPDESERFAERMASDESLSRRVANATAVFKLLDCYESPAPSEALIARTVAAAGSAARTQSLLDREAARARTPSRSTFNMKELWAMAALVVVVASILLPSFHHASRLAQDQACQAKAGQIGVSLGHYASDHKGLLPAIGASNAAWLVGGAAPDRISNSRNLWALIHNPGGRPYASAAIFQCPAGGETRSIRGKLAGMVDFPGREYISYSYHNGVNAKPLRRSDEVLRGVAADMAILADQTPMFVNGRFEPMRLGCANSLNHGRRGQAVLYLDMHVAWTECATVGVNRDNIWLVQGISSYRGIERPASRTDSFLLPSFIEVAE